MRTSWLLLTGFLGGCFYRVRHGCPLEGFLPWAAFFAVFHLFDRLALTPYLEDQRKKQAVLRIVIREAREVSARCK